jgi:hypothetical protein
MMSPQQQQALAQSRLVEAGWLGWSATMDPVTSKQQLYEMRMAFFAGAHHMFANMIAASHRDGDGAAFMNQIDDELNNFIRDHMLYHVAVAGNG